ncbi:MAG: tetraacyldisaccharide 4'-kinase [Xanthomonadaceae bacterium]|nr:tetraacyldisaccharide 4'-kinase [Xanthomonadaceae bacterium]
MRRRLARKIERIWYSQLQPPLALRVAARLYRYWAISNLQRPSLRPPCPVIVVGNLVAGGSGKTPLVAALAGELAQRLGAASVAIVSRGYRGIEPARPLRVGPDSRACQVGDEARELFARTGLAVWVCARRARALDQAWAHGARVVISDDGLQHRALARSFELCVIDQRRGFGNGYVLPAGPLRQPLERLETVDLVLVKQPGPSASAASSLANATALADGSPPGAVAFQLEALGLQAVDKTDRRPPQPPAAIDAIAGIADPQPFFETLEGRGFVVRRHPLADHQPLDRALLDRLAGPVVMTVKDSMRLPQGGRRDVFALDVRACVPDQVFERVFAHVREFKP